MRYKPLQNITAWFNCTSAFQKLQVSEALGLPNICILMSPVERLRLDDCASKKTSLFFFPREYDANTCVDIPCLDECRTVQRSKRVLVYDGATFSAGGYGTYLILLPGSELKCEKSTEDRKRESYSGEFGGHSRIFARKGSKVDLDCAGHLPHLFYEQGADILW